MSRDGDIREADKIRGPSREEIESLCILHVLAGGCPANELAGRLGLSGGLTSVVAMAVGPLVHAGWVVQDGAQFSLTACGNEWLKNQLAAFLR